MSIAIVANYNAKLMLAEEAVKLVPSKGVISIGMRAATPPALLKALENKIREDPDASLKVYYMRCGSVALDTIFQEDLMYKVHPYSSMLSVGEIELANKGYDKGQKYINYVPISFSNYSRTIKNHTDLDTFLVTVAPMDRFGYFNFGICGDYAIDLARHAKNLIVEVNKNMPRTAGGTVLHISEVNAIIENDTPITEQPSRAETDTDRAIGKHIALLINDGATIQMGVGGVPNAVCKELSNFNDLGIHTEVFTTGMMELIQSGAVNNMKKTLHRNYNVFNFAIGDRMLYDFIDNNPTMLCYPASYTNSLQTISKNDNMVCVNSFIEIDLFGQVNAEFIKGHQFSGIGGQLDFIRGVRYSKNGVNVLASSSTAGNGKFSKIIPKLQTITSDSRVDVEHVVTEHGIVNLAGLSTSERAKALIGIADPKFKDELIQQANDLHIFKGASLDF